ncbi:MAG: addiction module protein [Candidatus Aminicenantes bacterium]|nr:addiction module protein [Candidatus Aminicenantes bacterium]
MFRLLIQGAYNGTNTEKGCAAMTLKELETEALRLNPAGRARLAKKLLNSLDVLSEAEVERLWVEEAERRNDQIERGVVEARRAEDVIQDARARLG